MRDSLEIYYKSSATVPEKLNESVTTRLDSIIAVIGDSTTREITRLDISGATSPEGTVALNKRLARLRAKNIFEYLNSYFPISESAVSFTFIVNDWEHLLTLVKEDPDVPQRDRVLNIINSIVAQNKRHAQNGTDITEKEARESLDRLKSIGNGEAYRYLYEKHFPLLRKSRLVMEYALIGSYPQIGISVPSPSINTIALPPSAVNFELLSDLIPLSPVSLVKASQSFVSDNILPEGKRPFYMGLKTNLLYDALAIPNLSAEFYLGRNWSLAGGGYYAWWSYDRRHRYWRIYGGGLTLRRWFGKAASRKPLTGHHLGLYADLLTFDFELGGTGYMGGVPGGTLLDRCMYMGGIEYGYSLPIASRFNLDFTIGIGYLGGTYIKYFPFYGDYFKEKEVKFNYFGPTRAEISLVWLIGRGNKNKKKGGGL